MSLLRDILLTQLLEELICVVNNNFDYWELAQKIWDTSLALTDHEDKLFREYLQWVEGNLDLLLNLEADQKMISQFLTDQMVVIEASKANSIAIESVQKKGALAYFLTAPSAPSQRPTTAKTDE